jgi:hypothetical protein
MVISGPDVGVMEGNKGTDVGNAPKMSSGDHSASGLLGTSANPSVLFFFFLNHHFIMRPYLIHVLRT